MRLAGLWALHGFAEDGYNPNLLFYELFLTIFYLFVGKETDFYNDFIMNVSSIEYHFCTRGTMRVTQIESAKNAGNSIQLIAKCCQT